MEEEVPKVHDFFEETMPNMQQKQFRRWFRLNPATFHALAEVLQNDENEKLMGRKPISFKKRLGMTLTFLGTQMPSYHLVQVYDICEESFLRQTTRMMEYLILNLKAYIVFPRKEDFPRVSRDFDAIGRYFPNVIGAMDGCHLEIELHGEDPHAYYNYLCFHSIHLLAVSLADLRFSYVNVGFPGRAHDSHVFRMSDLGLHLSQLMAVPGPTLVNTPSIIADSAFLSLKQVVTAFQHNQRGITRDQRIFNSHLSSKRQVVERTFGLLQKRFPRVQYLRQLTLRKKIKVVLAACVLHNICVMEGDYFSEQLSDPEAKPVVHYMYRTFTDENSCAGLVKRNLLVEEIRLHNAANQ